MSTQLSTQLLNVAEAALPFVVLAVYALLASWFVAVGSFIVGVIKGTYTTLRYEPVKTLTLERDKYKLEAGIAHLDNISLRGQLLSAQGELLSWQGGAKTTPPADDGKSGKPEMGKLIAFRLRDARETDGPTTDAS